MDVSISTVAYPQMPLAKQLPLISQAGFRYVCLMACDLWNFQVSSNTRDGFESINDLLDHTKLKVDWVHLPYATTNLLTEDMETRTIQQSVFCNMVTMAGRSGALVAVFHPFAESAMSLSSDDTDKASRQIISFLEPVVEAAEAAGVLLALENVQMTAVNNTPLHQVIDVVLQQLPSLYVCLDRGHAEVAQEMDFYFPRYAQRIVALHVNDNLGFMDEHRLPGEGTIDWPALVCLLQQSRYKGMLGLEVVAKNTTFSHLPAQEWFAEAYQRACILAQGKQPPGPDGGTYLYMQRQYDLKHSGKFFQFGELLETTKSKSELRLELAAGVDWEGKPFGDIPPTVSQDGIASDDPFTLVARIDVVTSAMLRISCVLQTDNVFGKEPWQSATILAIPFDHQGEMIGFATLGLVTGTKEVHMNRSLQINANLVGHVELWIRKMPGTTGSCKFSKLEVALQPMPQR